MKKILTIVGARPQFIKASMVTLALRSIDNVSEIIIHSGQHYDQNMSQVFFEELEIPEPDYNLGVGSGSHGSQTAKMLERIEKQIVEIKPDYVIVYGDTNSTLAGALAAVKVHVPVAHVEAGLRSFNRKMPEEINRILTDHIADLLFTPTEGAVKNLKQEGIYEGNIKLVGDVMYDAALHYGEKAEYNSEVLQKNNLQPGNYILATVHRAENTDVVARLRAIMEGLSLVARETIVVIPLHPRTRMVLQTEAMMNKINNNIMVLEPLGYLDMIMLEKHAALIVTDSGGVQKEAFFYKVPCVTLREETEWLELVNAGWNNLCPPSSGEEVYSIIINSINKTGKSVELYGSGNAALKIVNSLSKVLS